LADVSRLAPAFSFLKSSIYDTFLKTKILEDGTKTGLLPTIKKGSLAVWDYLKNINLKSIALKIAGAAQAAYSTVVGLATGKISIATIATQVWNAVISANPIFWLITGIVAAGAAIAGLCMYLNRASVAQKLMGELSQTVGHRVIEEKSKVEQLIGTIQNQNKSRKEQIAALEELKGISGEYFGGLTLEEAQTNKLTEAKNRYIAALVQESITKAASEKLTEIQKAKFDMATDKSGPSEWEYIKAGALGGNAVIQKQIDDKAKMAELNEQQRLITEGMSYMNGTTKVSNAFDVFGKNKVKPITSPITKTEPDKNPLSFTGSAKNTADNITSGGSKPTNITIHLQKLQEKIEIHSATLTEGVQELESKVTEALLRVLNSANTMAR